MGKKRVRKGGEKGLEVQLERMRDVAVRSQNALLILQQDIERALSRMDRVMQGVPYPTPARKLEWREKPDSKGCYWWVEGHDGLFETVEYGDGLWAKRKLGTYAWTDLTERVLPVPGRPD